MNYAKDYEACKLVAELSGLKCVMLPEIARTELAIGVMSKMRLAVAMRLHCLLFAANSGVPSVGISYDPKVSSFVEYTGCGGCIEYDELKSEKLADMIRLLCNTDKKAEFEESLRKVRQAEHLNLETAQRLMSKE